MMQVFILTRLGLEATINWTCYYTTDEVRNFEEKNGHIVENLLIVIYQKNTWYVTQRQGIIICLQKRIMCSSETTYLTTDCYSNELAL
jgi:hypothetical protein